MTGPAPRLVSDDLTESDLRDHGQGLFFEVPESVFSDRLMFGVVSVHPHPDHWPDDFNPHDPCRYFIRSAAFATQFPHVTEIEVFDILTSYCAPKKGGPLGAREFTLTDSNGDVQLFTTETFFNRHEALTLAARLRTVPKAVVVKAVADAG